MWVVGLFAFWLLGRLSSLWRRVSEIVLVFRSSDLVSHAQYWGCYLLLFDRYRGSFVILRSRYGLLLGD